MDQKTSLTLHAVSHAGHVRPNNEDAHALHPEVGLAALADGMGGSLAGEVAAAMAMDIAAGGLAAEITGQPELQTNELQESELLKMESLMRACARRANAAIHERSLQDAQCVGMGTTLVMAVFRGPDLLIAHAGDSRAYRLRPRAWRLPTGVQYRHEIQRLTRDHNVGQSPDATSDGGYGSIQNGAGSPDHEDDARLTRAIGVEPDVVLELHRHRLLPEDIVVLCSDGLTDMVADARIEQIAHAVLGGSGNLPRPQELADLGQALLDEALRAGGNDNITVVLGAHTADGAPGV